MTPAHETATITANLCFREVDSPPCPSLGDPFAHGKRQGGNWPVRNSLAQTGHRLVGLGQVPETKLRDVLKEFTPEELERWAMTSNTPVGRLHHLGPVLRLSETPPRWARPLVPLGYYEPAWPERAT